MATLDQLALDLHDATVEAEDALSALILGDLTRTITKAWNVAVHPRTITAAATDLAALRRIADWRLPDEATDILTEVFRQGAVTAVASYGVSGKGDAPITEELGGPVFDPEVERYMREASNRLVGIGDAAWEVAHDYLADGLAHGIPRETMKNVLDRVLRVSEERSDRIVRTEVNMAANAGVSAAGQLMAEAGLSVRKRWFTMGDHRVRPTHEAADGQEVELEEAFIVGGAALMFPGDPHGPVQEVVNCRCTHLIIQVAAPAPVEELAEVREGMGDIDVPVEDFEADKHPANSALANFDRATGTFSPERQAIHDEIIREMLDGLPAQEHPQMVMLGGGPASGKTTQVRAHMRPIPDSVTVDADAIKVKLLSRTLGEDKANWPKDWPQFSHEESSYLVKRVTAGAYERRVNVVIDGVGDGSPAALGKKLAAARRAGYEVRGEYATIEIADALERAAKRGMSSGRELLNDQIIRDHRGASNALAGNLDGFDELNVYDTTLRDQPKLLFNAKGNVHTVHDEVGWQRFLTKGTERVGMGDIEIPVAAFEADNHPANSALKFYDDATGDWKPDRARFHDRLVEEYLGKHAPQDAPEFVMLGGGPASGKSTQVLDNITTHPDRVKIDADELKLRILTEEFGPDKTAWPADWPQYSHEESSYLASRITAGGYERRINVILDGTGDGSVGSLATKLANARAAGYKVRGEYATIPIDVALERAATRAARTGRTLLPDQVIGTHRRVSQALAANIDGFDELHVYDTLVRDHPKMIFESHAWPGTQRILDPAAWDAFLAKAETDPLDWYRQVVREALVDDSVVRTDTGEVSSAALLAERRIRDIGAQIDAEVQRRVQAISQARIRELRAQADVALDKMADAWNRDAAKYAKAAGFNTWEEHWEAEQIRTADPRTGEGGISLENYRARVMMFSWGRGQTPPKNSYKAVRDRWLAADKAWVAASAEGAMPSGAQTQALAEVLEERGIAMGPDTNFKQTQIDYYASAQKGYTQTRKTKQPKVFADNSMEALKAYPTSWHQASEAAFVRVPVRVKTRIAELRAQGQDSVADAVERKWLEETGMMVGPAAGGGTRGWQWSTVDNTGARINIPSTRQDDLGLYVHEWGHRMEAVNRLVTRAEWIFRTRRGEGKPVRWLGGGYARSEVAVDDKFSVAYAGKVYADRPSESAEVLTMGMEGLYRGTGGTRDDIGRMLLEDAEYRHLIMGLLALL